MNVLEFCVSIAGMAIGLFSVWFTSFHSKKAGKQLAAHQGEIDKDLTAFKHDLDVSSSGKLESFRAHLEIQMVENRWIREKRFGIIQELYSHLADCLFIAEKIVEPIKVDKNLDPSFISWFGGLAEDFQNETRLRNFSNLANGLANFRKAYLRDRIILEPATCEVLDEVERMSVSLLAVAMSAMIKEVPAKDDSKL
jgi:hypothetical protein